jgi:hypothetical protein
VIRPQVCNPGKEHHQPGQLLRLSIGLQFHAMTDTIIIVTVCVLALLVIFAIVGFVSMVASLSGQAVQALQKAAKD